MDGNRFKSDSNLLHNKCARIRRVDGGTDRINELPNELIVLLLCFLPLRDAARTSILSSRWLDLWKQTPHMKFDRLSQLPDQVLVFILSLLPLKNAAATSVLSSRWLDLWKHKPNLDFKYSTLKKEIMWKEKRDPWDVERSKYVDLVDSVLQSHKAISLKEFGIDFFMNKSGHKKLANWLEFVFLKGVERLELNLKCSGPKQIILEELLRLCRPETIILFKSLKRLCLKWLKVSGEDIKLFLRNCPLLEELIIGEVNLLSDVEVCGASLKLKHLEVYSFNPKKSIKVCAPNLTWLKVDEASKKVLLDINVPKLVGAYFRFRCLSPESVQKFASAVFCFSSQLKILNLTIHNHKMFFADAIPQMPNLEKLVVEYYGVKFQSLLPVTALVWASPRLEEFKLLYVKGSDQSSGEVIRKVERSPHRFLKVFKLGGFLAVGDHIELVTYISDNCVALEKIIIGCSPFSLFTNFVRDLSNVGKAIQDTLDYAKRELQGKLPQQIQLQLL